MSPCVLSHFGEEKTLTIGIVLDALAAVFSMCLFVSEFNSFHLDDGI